MPKRASADSPRVRKAQFAKLKLTILELQSVRPYITADTDADTRREMRASLAGSIEKIQSILRWLDAVDKPTTGMRKGTLKNPIAMGVGAAETEEGEQDDA